jgi:phosphoribosylformimino-5-aminoimidazole carboxamide ribotide isomerase
MKIIPAIDLQGGACVRLYQGDFDKRTEYSKDPTAVARDFQAKGFEYLHLVDLDGAKHGEQKNRAIVAAIAMESDLEIQLGGGIRDRQTVADWLSAGISRCVIGSLAVKETDTVKNWLEEFGPDRIVLALDISLDDRNLPILATHGWTESSGIDLWQCIDAYIADGIRHVLCTDVARDGAMSGPNLDLYRKFVRRYPSFLLQASGGVRDANDLHELSKLGASAAITGRALLDGRIKTEELGAFLRVA